MTILEQLFTAQLSIFGQQILWREVIGNAFGFASAIGGLRRRVWVWPVGIAGNVLLFTVFFGVAFANPQHTTLFGQAGRQVFFIVTSVYGWWRWSAARSGRVAGEPAIVPRWATGRERVALLGLGLLGVVVAQQVFWTIGAGWPAPRWYYWSDAWIFIGSIAATYAMARGWNEFWLIWLAVDAVGVPLLLKSGFYPSAVLYAAYGGLVCYGFAVWLRSSRGRDGSGGRGESRPEESGRAESGHGGSGDGGSGRGEDGRAEGSRGEDGRAEGSRVEGGRVEGGRVEGGRVEGGRVEGGRVETRREGRGAEGGGRGEVGVREGV